MKDPAAQKLGRRGGKKTAKRGRAYYREIGRKGLAKRYSNAIPPAPDAA